MNINRNNYEEYFLLYTDNELSLSKRLLVEEFIKQNPDLEEELLMFQQLVAMPDKDLLLGDKSFLYRHSEIFIDEKNYEEIFILYFDGELNDAEKKETESFVQQHPTLKEQFEIFKKTKLVTDELIVFPSKKLLYHYEEKPKFIFPAWQKFAAAAMLAGIGLWSGINILQNYRSKEPVIVGKINEPIKSIPKHENIIQQKIQVPNVVVMQATKPLPLIKTKRAIAPPAMRAKNALNSIKQLQNVPAKIKNEDRELVADLPPARIKEQLPNSLENAKDLPVKQITVPAHIAEKATTDNAHPVSYTNTPETKNENYVFYNVSDEKFKKSKLGGFLKKVTRMVERASPFNNSKSGADIASNQ
ncbi:MAG: hypothetical protein H0W12_11135 [Chitinophagaceae bacterium]|nr:hypothetical protein [Chitinophagaceae bacterium]